MTTHFIKSLKATALLLAAAALTPGCSMINDDSDCVDSYNLLKFVYEHNMAYSCAFDKQVDAVHILVFDNKTGLMVTRHDVQHVELNDNNEMPLRLPPGDYELLVWAGVIDKSYDVPRGTLGVSHIDDFDCYLHRKVIDGLDVVDEDIDRLFHARIPLKAGWASPSKPNRVTVPLMKNTNTVRVVLQHISGDPVDADDFEFHITDDNGWLNFDNSIRSDKTIDYRPWYSESGAVDINTHPTYPDGTPAKVAPSRASLGASLAEFTVSRLMMQNNPTLTIVNRRDGEVVLSIPVNDYALLVKGFYHRQIEDQEYLDRQDEYNMTFFLDRGNRWLKTQIIINNWVIVRNNVNAE